MAASIKIVKDLDDEEETPAIVDKKDICTICVEKEARYTCPRCNVRYCSLNCYRHTKHEGCSESFYKDWVMEDMKEHCAKPEDRQKILEMLSREREQQADDSDDDETPDLSERLQGLDLDCDAAEVWKRLTPLEREEFAHMLKDGRMANLVTIWTPWWMAESPTKVQEATEDKAPKGFPPHIKDIPDINHMLKSKPSADIKYNMVNVISAYAFVTRLHNGDHHECPLECAEELLKVCHVLNQNVNYPGSREAIHAVIQEVQKAGSGFVVPDSFPLVLVGDVVRILRGRKISPLCGALSALSDLVVLLKEASKDMRKGGKKKRKAEMKQDKDEPDFDRQLFLAKKKVTFLLSWTQRYGMCLTPLCEELSLELDCLKCEAAEMKSLQKCVEEGLQSGKLKPGGEGRKVEELT